MRRRLLALGFGALAALLLLEGVLQLASVMFRARGPEAVWRSRGSEKGEHRFRLLCVGDSNTFGAGLAASESYPSKLQALLDADFGDSIEVVNLGVPGTNSAQLLYRFPGYVRDLEPDLVVVGVGVNDFWNPARVAEVEGFGARLHARLLALRSYKLAFLLWDASRLASESRGLAVGEKLAVEVRRTQVKRKAGGDADSSIWEMKVGDSQLAFENPQRDLDLAEEAHQELLASNLRRIARLAHELETPVVFVTYAANVGRYAVANGAIQLLSLEGETVISQVFPQELAPYLPEGWRSRGVQELFFSDMHPRAPVYAAAAANLRDALVAGGWLPRTAGGTTTAPP